MEMKDIMRLSLEEMRERFGVDYHYENGVKIRRCDAHDGESRRDIRIETRS